MKPSSNTETNKPKPHLNDDLLKIVKSFVDYFETVDEALMTKETEEREKP